VPFGTGGEFAGGGGGGSGGGGGAVNSVSAGDTSVLIPTTTGSVTVTTGTLDAIATDHPPAGNWSNNSHKITSVANGTAPQDAAAFGQIPTALVSSVSAGDTSVVVSPTTGAVTVTTATLDVIATDHPPAGNWSNNSHKITSVANGTAAQDAAAFGQIPTATNLPYTVNIVASGTTTATANQVYVCTGACTITLPASPSSGQWVLIKSKTTGTVTITGTVDGVTNPTITTQYQSNTILWDGTTWDNV
jgi:hypothetical protein